MKLLLTSFALMLSLGYVFSQTQAEMNRSAHEKYKQADLELNSVYQQILTDYKEDTVFIEALRQSQRVWIKFRDTELNMKYPEREYGWYGTIHPWCVSNYKTELTTYRVSTLQKWLIREPEGDACTGSINPKE